MFPELSPLRHSAWRERLQKCALPVATVCASASRFAQANMRTMPVRASCAITGTRPSASNLIAPSSVSAGVDMLPISYRDATRPQVIVRLADGRLAEVEDRRRQHRLGVPSAIPW